jgi:membrane-associated protease RseP (regulator of RpoE activity)
MTVATAYAMGSLVVGPRLPAVLAYVVAVLVAIGAHAVGHLVAARRTGVLAYGPYFVPDLGLSGVGGAYVKLSWPIEDRRARLRIFAAGPILGFAVSATFLVIGIALSRHAPPDVDNAIQFGDSLLVLAAQRLVFPHMPADHEVFLHPLGLAGYLSLLFNLWHLFPAGRLDGGRLVYAVFGHRSAVVVSWVTIATLGILGARWPGWWVIALFAALTMIRLGRQHPVAQNREAIPPSWLGLVGLMLVMLSVTFIPVPVKIGR